MNTLTIYNDKAYFDGDEIEGFSFQIKEGILGVAGRFVRFSYVYQNVYSSDILKLARTENIRFTRFRKRPYLPSGRYKLIDTTPFTFISNNFSIKDYRT
jgi:hypothetical protein